MTVGIKGPEEGSAGALPVINFKRLCTELEQVETDPASPIALRKIARVRRSLAALAEAEQPQRADVRGTVRERLSQLLIDNGLGAGADIAEIGGAMNSFYREMPEHRFTFLSLFPAPETPGCIVADICHCPHIADNSFDAVISQSVFEHVQRPWLAGREITRILRPGGISLHYVPFSYFYHCAPEDYWRYTTAGIETLFPELETIVSEFDSGRRRRNNVGSENQHVDEDGGPQFAVDAFGGWRENWWVFYAGRKPLGGSRRPVDVQLVVDLMRAITRHGLEEDDAAVRTAQVLRLIHVDGEGRLTKRAKPQRQAMAAARVLQIWRRKGRMRVIPGPNQFVLPAMFPLAELLNEAEALEP